MANGHVDVADAGSPTKYIDNTEITTGGSPATVERQRVQVGGVNFTDLADVVAGDTGQSGLVVHGSRKEVTFTTTTNQAVASTDVSNYRFVSAQFTTFGGGSATFQHSNDNSTWISCPASNAATGNAAPEIVSASATGIYVAPLKARYFRINVTGISGTVAGTIEFFAIPPTHRAVGIDSVGVQVPVGPWFTAADTFTNGNTMVTTTMGYNGTSWDRRRIGKFFASGTATASGDTTIYTPTSGKKARILAYSIDVTADAATSGGADIDFILRDATTNIGMAATVFCPAVAGTTFGPGYSSGWRTVPNGNLGASANNVVAVNLSAALSSGKCRVNLLINEE